jgi:hypothetical protein
MENYHSAFLPGEYVKLRDQNTLNKLQQRHSGDPATLGLHTVLPVNMAAHANKRVCVIGVSYYHFGWALYELHGLPDHWPEAAILDPSFDKLDSSSSQPANLTYQAVETDDNGFVCICDMEGRAYCTLRKHDVKRAVEDLNRVATLRSRVSFARRYNFDGVECFEKSASG